MNGVNRIASTLTFGARRILAVLIVALLATTASQAADPPTSLDAKPDADGFIPLLDGKTLAGWRQYKKNEAPNGWSVVDGAVVRTAGGDDMMTIDQFGDYELRLDWKISPGGNSGIIYRVRTGDRASYYSGPEYQVLDDKGKNQSSTSAGSLYGLYAPQGKEIRPAGKWNTARIVLKGNHGEHWLNGKKVVEFEFGSDDWNKRIAKTKFSKWKQFGSMKKGHICLQQHGGKVSYRNIRIKPLSDAK